MDRRRLTVPVAKGEAVSAVLALPPDRGRMRGTGVIVAHGAGNDMEYPLLAAFTDGLDPHAELRDGLDDSPGYRGRHL